MSGDLRAALSDLYTQSLIKSFSIVILLTLNLVTVSLFYFLRRARFSLLELILISSLVTIVHFLLHPSVLTLGARPLQSLVVSIMLLLLLETVSLAGALTALVSSHLFLQSLSSIVY